MKEKQKKKLTEKQKSTILVLCAVLAVPLLSLAALILRAIALFTDFGSGDYFLSLSSLPSAYLFLSLAAVLLFLLFAIIARKRLALAPSPEAAELPLLFSSAFLSLTLAATLIVSVFSVTMTGDPLIAFFHALIAALSGITVAYLSFFLRGIAPAHSLPRTYLSLAPALLSLSVAILLYFDHTTQINAPAKLLSLAAFLALAFAFLIECRYYFASPKPAMRYLTLGIGFYLSISASLPNLIYTLVRGRALVLSSVYDFLMFAFALYLLARLIELLPQRDREAHSIIRNAVATAAEDDTAKDEGETEAPVDGEEEAPLEASNEGKTEEVAAPKKSAKKSKTEKAE